MNDDELYAEYQEARMNGKVKSEPDDQEVPVECYEEVVAMLNPEWICRVEVEECDFSPQSVGEAMMKLLRFSSNALCEESTGDGQGNTEGCDLIIVHGKGAKQ
jgi:hypothetical protein